jgi:hypothetical protein
MKFRLMSITILFLTVVNGAFSADGIEDPWPGYIVGGGHTATNWQDIQDDYRT